MVADGCVRLTVEVGGGLLHIHQKFRTGMAVLETCSAPIRGHEQGNVLSLSEQMYSSILTFKQIITSRGDLV